MKITQEPKYQPITLVLETKEEADMFWKMVGETGSLSTQVNWMTTQISDWFYNVAKL